MQQDPSTYVRALSSLTRQVQEQASLLTIRDTLRLVGTHSRAGDVIFERTHRDLVANGSSLGAHSIDAEPLVAAMAAHGVNSILIEHDVAPKELLLLATLLAGAVSDGATSVVTLADDLGLWHIRLNSIAQIGDSISESETSLRDGGLSPEFAAQEAMFATPSDAAAHVINLHERGNAAVNVGEGGEVVSVLQWLTDAEAAALHDDARVEIAAVWTTGFNDFATHGALRPVAALLVTDTIDRAPLMRILQRAGEAGASAVVSQLSTASTLRERRMLFDAIRELKTGIAVLLRSLDHPQWFVVRNAASLLGELRVAEAELALTALLGHGDVRVRSAAVGSIGKLASPTAGRTLERALRDVAAEVRRQAFYGLIARGDAVDPTALADALEAETTVNTQLDMLDELARSKSPEAPRRLARICSSSMNSACDPLYRLGAIEALVRSKPAAALPYLRRMTGDREPTIRLRSKALLDAAQRAVTA